MPTSAKKRWLLVIPEHQQEWIRETAEATDLRGSDVVAELIDRLLKDKTEAAKFKSSLAELKTKKELSELEEKKAAIEDAINKLRR